MITPQELLTAFDAVGHAFNIVKTIQRASGALKDAEVNAKFADLYCALADAKVAIADAQAAQIERDREIASLRAELQLKRAIVYEAPFYWIMRDEAKEGPCCQKCYDTTEKVVRLQWSAAAQRWHCFNCQWTYQSAGDAGDGCPMPNSFEPG